LGSKRDARRVLDLELLRTSAANSFSESQARTEVKGRYEISEKQGCAHPNFGKSGEEAGQLGIWARGTSGRGELIVFWSVLGK